MGRVEEEIAELSRIRYKPPISKYGGSLILLICMTLIVLSYWTEIEVFDYNSLLLERLPISFDILPSIPEKIFTGTMIYALVVLIIGIALQFYNVKKWHNRRFATH